MVEKSIMGAVAYCIDVVFNDVEVMVMDFLL